MDHLDRVPEPLGDVALGLSVLEQEGGVGVAQVVEANADHARALLGASLEPVGDHVRVVG